jgi:hypothetical protein
MLKIVHLVLLTELMLHLVTVHQATMKMMLTLSVHLVLTNVENVLLNIVLLVVETDKWPLITNVLAQVPPMKIPPVNVQPVTILVLNVTNITNVTFVLLTDHKSVYQNVLAQLELMTTKSLYAHLAHTNAWLVELAESVILVNSQESKNHIVIVLMDTMNKPKSVNHVLTNAWPVLLKNIAPNVLETEPVSQIVIAHLEDLITEKMIHNVILVLSNVNLVLEEPITVTNVPETESTHTFVIVHLVI